MADDKLLQRMAYRVSLFVRRGLTEQAAEGWADKLVGRDAERDDRRLCVECAHWTDGIRCKAGAVRVVDLLHRCHLFAWQVPGAR